MTAFLMLVGQHAGSRLSSGGRPDRHPVMPVTSRRCPVAQTGRRATFTLGPGREDFMGRQEMRGRLPQWQDEAGNGGVIAAIVAAVMAVLLFIAHHAVTIAHAVH